MPESITPVTALLLCVVALILRFGWDLGGVIVPFIKTGTATAGEVLCLVLALVLVLIALYLGLR
jgi:hypothetical protein